MNSHFQEKKMFCAHSSILRMWETVDAGHRSWMETGTRCAKPSSRGAEGEKWETLCNKYVVVACAVACGRHVE